MGRAADFFTPVMQAHCEVVAVISLSADRAEGNRFEATLPAKLRAVAATLWRCSYTLATRSPRAMYVPISQWGLPLLRDVLIVVLTRIVKCAPVLHLHGAQLPARLSSNRALRKVLAGGHWIVLSEAVAAELHASGCSTESVTVVRNPAPPAVRPRVPGPPRLLRVGWLGTMCRAKGFDVLCDAVGRSKRRGMAVEFSVAGMRLDVPGSAMAVVDKDLGVLDPADVPSFWAEVDAFVLPARWVEGLPFVLLEGLQAGCAVAATPSPGCAELFAEGCVEPVEATVDSVAGFLKACGDDLEGVRRRQQKAWQGLRPLYEHSSVEKKFVRFWQDTVFGRDR
ncbi:glycosyltransferase family 4 protein [Streptomyces shenzhenensis]|uniref:glycosyltransferase family 4 protein n=1 Tax=Streptomyces shenzhenensis TaxID=943815 RepID=UPI001F31AE5C|nr:glycosyltransferase family 4 protein [Streptomyces shenzhenensis]